MVGIIYAIHTDGRGEYITRWAAVGLPFRGCGSRRNKPQFAKIVVCKYSQIKRTPAYEIE